MISSFRLKLKNNLGLYMVTTEYQEKSHIDIASAAIEGGVSIIQYREKNKTSRELFNTASELREITYRSGVKLIINDRADIALAVGADGVHLGQDDLSLKAAREMMGYDYIIGISATNFDEAVGAAREGADYIGLGPIFPTPSKEDAAPPIGIEGLRKVAGEINIPIVAIGGITIDNVAEVVDAGAAGVAVISAVAATDDMVAATHTLCEIIERAMNKRFD